MPFCTAQSFCKAIHNSASHLKTLHSTSPPPGKWASVRTQCGLLKTKLVKWEYDSSKQNKWGAGEIHLFVFVRACVCVCGLCIHAYVLVVFLCVWVCVEGCVFVSFKYTFILGKACLIYLDRKFLCSDYKWQPMCSVVSQLGDVWEDQMFHHLCVPVFRYEYGTVENFAKTSIPLDLTRYFQIIICKS